MLACSRVCARSTASSRCCEVTNFVSPASQAIDRGMVGGKRAAARAASHPSSARGSRPRAPRRRDPGRGRRGTAARAATGRPRPRALAPRERRGRPRPRGRAAPGRSARQLGRRAGELQHVVGAAAVGRREVAATSGASSVVRERRGQAPPPGNGRRRWRRGPARVRIRRRAALDNGVDGLLAHPAQVVSLPPAIDQQAVGLARISCSREVAEGVCAPVASSGRSARVGREHVVGAEPQAREGVVGGLQQVGDVLAARADLVVEARAALASAATSRCRWCR